MSLFVVTARDAADSEGPRTMHRDAHFAYIGSIVDSIAVSGPLKDADGANCGSLIIYDVDTYAEAEALLRADPYFAGGIWGDWTITAFVPAAGAWVGGAVW